MLSGKTILLGVTGGIAAYKAAELVRLFVKAHADVHVIMTKAAMEFVTPLTFQTLSSNPVHTELFNLIAERDIGHISLAERADLLVVAPATANAIARIAAGMADDMLTTTALAAKCPFLIVPAMNANMYANPLYRENEKKLRGYGYHFVDPVRGMLACGYEGEGKMASPEAVFESAVSLLTVKDFEGMTVMVTAGPTREELDPVRFVSNHSSGKMGYSIARAAARRGAKVILVSGPVALDPPSGVELVPVVTAREMRDAVMCRAGECDAVVKAAAVADYRPAVRRGDKIKKGTDILTVELERNPDILTELGSLPERPFLVGFAAETVNIEEYARMKLEKKNADMIIANQVGIPGTGFNAENNRAEVFFRDGGSEVIDLMTKDGMAARVLDIMLPRIADRRNQPL